MFGSLLAVTFVIAFFVSMIAALVFYKPIKSILERIIAESISGAWIKYIMFAVFVTGISSGVRVWDLEKYITPPSCGTGKEIIVLNTSRWVLEIYRTAIGTLQGVAWMLLVFFVFALIAYTITRVFESKKGG